MPETRDDRSLGDLFAELTHETSTLVRQEVELARVELSQKVSRVGRDAASLAVGGALAYAGLLAIVAAVILGLGEAGLPWWLSALLVGVVIGGIGYVFVDRARSAIKEADLAPRRTAETLKENREWAKEQLG
ncbi:MAG: phage holin family protein [Chloroflexota bacterium]|nr:phage holin family protein [Chloroflexota bacterium]